MVVGPLSKPLEPSSLFVASKERDRVVGIWLSGEIRWDHSVSESKLAALLPGRE